MPNVINGTSTGSGGLITSGDDSGILNIQTNETTAITVNASQNVGVGVTPSAWSAGKAIEVGLIGSAIWGFGGPNETYLLSNAYYNSGFKYAATGTATQYLQFSGSHRWYNAPSGTAGNAITFTQAMTLDASGNLLVGATTAGGQGGLTIYPNGSGTSAQAGWTKAVDGVNNAALAFFAGATVVGTITYNNTTTAYNNLSDYRLKQGIQPMTGALSKVALLKPCTYKWSVDGSDGQGFIAHELAEVIPDAVTGEKDAVDENGNPKYQGIDTSFLVATLTAAIKEQQALIETLTQRITALEGA